ncbi:hypothetical protein L3Q82_016370, partial [Scortum barcoo]
SDSSSSNSKSDDITDDVSSEETKKQNTQPMASLLPTETETSRQPMNKLHSDHMIITDEENLTSEEMMSDQPMFAFSDGEGDHFNNATSSGRNLNHQLSLSDDLTSTEFNVNHKFSEFDDFDDFNNSTDSREVNQLTVILADYFDDSNNTRFPHLSLPLKHQLSLKVFSSESKEYDLSDSESKSDSSWLDSRNNSQSTELHPNPILTPHSNQSPESKYNPSLTINFHSSSEISQGESEESPTIKVPKKANTDAVRGANPALDYRTNTASIPASSED